MLKDKGILLGMWKILQYIWQTAQREFRIVGAVKIICLSALPTAYNWAATEWKWQSLSVSVLVTLTALIFALTLLWAIAKHAQKIEEPKFQIIPQFGGIFWIECNNSGPSILLEMKNISSIRLEHAECVLLRAVYGEYENSPYYPINRVLSFIESTEGKTASINPGSKKHLMLCHHVRDGEEQYLDFGDKGKIHFTKNTIIEIEASTSNSPAITKRFLIGYHKSGQLTIRLDAEIKPRPTANT